VLAEGAGRALVPELPASGVASFLRRHSARRELGDAHLEMESELIVQVRVGVWTEEATVRPPDGLPPHQAGCGRMSSTRETVAA